MSLHAPPTECRPSRGASGWLGGGGASRMTSHQSRQGTKCVALHFASMRRVWHALDGRIRQYYSVLLSDHPQELVQVLRRRLSDREAPQEEPKIDRVRPG